MFKILKQNVLIFDENKNQDDRKRCNNNKEVRKRLAT